jgi:hypothetical protein
MQAKRNLLFENRISIFILMVRSTSIASASRTMRPQAQLILRDARLWLAPQDEGKSIVSSRNHLVIPDARMRDPESSNPGTGISSTVLTG